MISSVKGRFSMLVSGPRAMFGRGCPHAGYPVSPRGISFPSGLFSVQMRGTQPKVDF